MHALYFLIQLANNPIYSIHNGTGHKHTRLSGISCCAGEQILWHSPSNKIQMSNNQKKNILIKQGCYVLMYKQLQRLFQLKNWKKKYLCLHSSNIHHEKKNQENKKKKKQKKKKTSSGMEVAISSRCGSPLQLDLKATVLWINEVVLLIDPFVANNIGKIYINITQCLLR